MVSGELVSGELVSGELLRLPVIVRVDRPVSSRIPLTIMSFRACLPLVATPVCAAPVCASDEAPTSSTGSPISSG